MYLNFSSFNKAKSITIVSVIEDRDYFLWQQEVQCYHMAENYSHLNYEVIILREKDEPSDWSKHISKTSNTSLYRLTEDEINSFKPYKCSYKPYGLYLRNSDSSKNVLENIFAIDSDVILNRDLDYAFLLEDDKWLYSNCESYLGYKYLSSKLSEAQILEMVNIVGADINMIKKKSSAGGAQYLYKKPTVEFFKKTSHDSIKLYEKLKQYQAEGSDVQIHTAEMWSQPWNSYLCAEVAVSEKLDFAWATDNIKEMANKPITHFAGSPTEGSFRKTEHVNPFAADLSNITIKENCAYHWKTLIEKYKHKCFSNKI